MASLPEGVQPVGGHPMCGKETAGFEAAEEGLYVNAPWVLAPLARTSDEALALAAELATAVGARPVLLPAERHDRMVAAISHLPYLAASALVASVADAAADEPEVWRLAAGGFRDSSRVAASDTGMFLDILMTNRTAVLAQLDRMGRHLDELRGMLERGDEAGLCAKLAASQRARSQWRPG
jgi:prephenate dehydrogenase